MCWTQMWGGVRMAHVRGIFFLLTCANYNLFFSSSLFLCLVFFSPHSCISISFPHIPMHHGSLDEPSDLNSLQSYGVLNLGLEDENFSDYAVDMQPLRSVEVKTWHWLICQCTTLSFFPHLGFITMPQSKLFDASTLSIVAHLPLTFHQDKGSWEGLNYISSCQEI